MFFQISPIRREKKPKVVIKEKSPEKIEVLSLAPFSAAPKLFFNGVKLGDSATCKLLLKNPTKQDLTIFLTRKIPEALNVRYNWEKTTIRKDSEVLFELTWTPVDKEASYHKITFESTTKTVHRDVPVAFKTSSPPKKSKPDRKTKPQPVSRKSPTKKYYSPKRYSPSPKKTSTYKKSPPRQYYTKHEVLSTQNTNYTIPEVYIRDYNMKGKENVPVGFVTQSNTKGRFMSSENVSFKLDYLNTAERRETFVLQREDSDVFNDSLEMNKSNDTPSSPNKQKRPPLSAYNVGALTPDISLGSYFKQKSDTPETPNFGFEYKLMRLESLCFTPTGTLYQEKENFLPEKKTTTVKNKKEATFDLPDLPPDLNLSSETFTTSRLSSETYVKDNTSFETYVKGNLSGGTYTKDSPIGQLENGSPLFSSEMSPNHHKGSLQNTITPISTYLQENYFNVENSKFNGSTNIGDLDFLMPENGRYEVDNINTKSFVFAGTQVENFNGADKIGSARSENNQINYGRPSHFDFSTPKASNNASRFSSITPENASRFDYTRPESVSQNINRFNFALSERQLSSIEEESFNVKQYPTFRKKSDLDLTANHSKPGGGFTGPKHWSKRGGAALRVAKNTSGLDLLRFTNTVCEETREEAVSRISKNDTKTVIIQNPFLLAASNVADPFITPQLYVSDEWIDQQEIYFKKWLNSLLTPPRELYSEDKVVDVAKVFQECKKREVETAPTKEDISNKYHVNAKLNSLRQSAQHLFRSKEISDVLSKVLLAVDNGKLSIRQDKDVHLNLSIKSDIMSLLLSYNPLWLRIGLETIYNETIPLHSNSDIVGISTFLINRLFKHPYLLKKYKSVHSAKYVTDFNKFFLKKFLILVYFLDQAKTRKLIPHDPCLFCKTGSVKESKELLLTLARELLSAVGDITKFLKFSGYLVTHVQTYIHEFDYAVKNLGVDLRDGIRLTKIMEIIVLKEGLTNNLRVPAISRLQKVHNMKLVFDSLKNAGYNILYDITPKDIVDGHREKTMSFLWQIIYKFEAPLMVKCASTIQIWFRSLPVLLKRRKLHRVRLEKENASSKIQKWYRRQKLAAKLRQFTELLKRYLHMIKIERAATKIQAHYKMYRQKNIYRQQIKAVKEIQKYSRGWLIRNFYKQRIKSAVIIQSYARMFMVRTKYLRIKEAARTIQMWYRFKKQAILEVETYRRFKSTTIFVQQKWRANVLGKKQKQEYEQLKLAVLNVQRRFRANCLCRTQQENYRVLKSATVYIQNWYRSIKSMTICRQKYLTLKHTVLLVEQRYAAVQMMKKERERYQKLKLTCVKIQKYYRANKLARETRMQYLQLKTVTLTVQRRFRAKQSMEKQEAYYKSLKNCTIFVQRQFRAKVTREKFLVTKAATVKIQVWFRATVEMRKCRSYYVSLQRATRVIEQKYKAKILMKKEVLSYQTVKNATIALQKRYRAVIEMRSCKRYYNQLKLTTIFVQRKFRANRAAKLQKMYYLQLRNAAVKLQSRYRARREMLKCKKHFENLKLAAVNIQRRYRANQLMKKIRRKYQYLLKSTITMQRFFRARQSMLKDRERFEKLKKAVTNIQARWRAIKVGKNQKNAYNNLRLATLIIQRKWKATKLAREELKQYETLRKNVLLVQRKWRANKLFRRAREEYLTLRRATLTLQNHWRARKLRKLEQEKFKTIRDAAVVLQRRFRATLQAKLERRKFENTRRAIIILQVRWRAYNLSKIDQEKYQKLRTSTIFIQQLWRAKTVAKKQRNYYVQLRRITLLIQQKWRAKNEGKRQMENYKLLKNTAIFIQRKWRTKNTARDVRSHYEKLRNAVILLQNRWRCKMLGRKGRMEYQKLQLMTILVQRRWRCLRSGRQAQEEYQLLRRTVIFVQQRWKAKKLMETEIQQYTSLRYHAIMVQRRFRANLEMRRQRTIYLFTKKSVVTIQRRYRGYLQTRKERREYLMTKEVVQKIQKYARGYLIRRQFAEYFTPEARERRKIEKTENEAATKIQSLWRGYKSRCVENPELGQIRARYIKAHVAALPENTLQFKCTVALQTIAHENSTLFHINRALEDIDYATRRCKNICVKLGKLLPDQLYLMLSSTSRSLPEMNACIFSVHILLNFNKLEETKNCSFVPIYIDKLITLMLSWCDKESQLFPALCTLFWLFAHTPQWKRFMLNLPSIKQRFEKIKGLVARKENMVKRQVVKGVTVFGSYKNLPMPSMVPDWGLDYKNNPFAFTNSVHALNSLMSILNI